MKRRLIIATTLISLAALAGITKGQQRGFSIKVQLEGLNERDTVFLVTYSEKVAWDSRFPISLDTIISQKVSENKQLNYSDEIINDGKMYALRVSGKKGVVMMLVSAGEQIQICGNLSQWPDVEVQGSKGTADFQSYQKAFAPLVAAKRIAEGNEFRKMFLAKQNNSLYSAYVVLMSRDMTVAERKAAYEQLTPYAKGSYFGLKIAKATKEDTLYEPIKEGFTIPNFKVKTLDGKIIGIHELTSKSKYTLLDFWASWCVPCRKGFPELLKADGMYRSKGLSIVGIGLAWNDIEKNWKKALTQETTTWTQVFDQDDKVRKLFRLTGIPSMVLVDQKGKLITFHPGGSGIDSFGPRVRGEELFETLDNLFK